MKTDLTEKRLMFLLGVPRSGTTIVASLFNSLEDGFCLGEPHWYLKTGHEDTGAYGKVKEHCRPVEDPKLIIETNIIPILQDTDYMLGSFKETWHRHHRADLRALLARNMSVIDHLIILFRDPILTLSSLRAHDWGELRPHHIVKDYYELDKLASHPKGIGLVFEDFCEGPLEYLNSRLPFQIEGPLDIKPTGHKYGDPRANRSDGIEVHERVINVPDHWIPQLDPAVSIWGKWGLE
jgi:hypothetical protein